MGVHFPTPTPDLLPITDQYDIQAHHEFLIEGLRPYVSEADLRSIGGSPAQFYSLSNHALDSARLPSVCAVLNSPGEDIAMQLRMPTSEEVYSPYFFDQSQRALVATMPNYVRVALQYGQKVPTIARFPNGDVNRETMDVNLAVKWGSAHLFPYMYPTVENIPTPPGVYAPKSRMVVFSTPQFADGIRFSRDFGNFSRLELFPIVTEIWGDLETV